MADLAATQSTNSDEWQTPQWLFRRLNYEFDFTLDAAATKENSLCPDYFDIEMNGLEQDWSGYTVWCNPPYSGTKFWMMKAWAEAIEHRVTTVMLVAARPDTRHWWAFASEAEVRFLPGRLKFGLSNEDKETVKQKNIIRKQMGKKPLDPENTSAPFPSAVVIFNGDLSLRTPTTIYWNIREERRK